ncbi:hypothetical protein GCM10022222_73780 [Amycolatopsis ultiminotia]|uniref:Lsr2 dimerization domain-containing protein n=2 Tax=Amycolatopsis ultiminotia TaxID=543629 RepID=A0ABP6YB48_9PSEU
MRPAHTTGRVRASQPLLSSVSRKTGGTGEFRRVAVPVASTIDRARETPMAKNTAVRVLDDLTGEPASETVSFALDGAEYDIDLAAGNAAALREFLDRYRIRGRRVGGRKLRTRYVPGAKPVTKTKRTKAKPVAGTRSAATAAVSRKTKPAKEIGTTTARGKTTAAKATAAKPAPVKTTRPAKATTTKPAGTEAAGTKPSGSKTANAKARPAKAAAKVAGTTTNRARATGRTTTAKPTAAAKPATAKTGSSTPARGKAATAKTKATGSARGRTAANKTGAAKTARGKATSAAAITTAGTGGETAAPAGRTPRATTTRGTAPNTPAPVRTKAAPAEARPAAPQPGFTDPSAGPVKAPRAARKVPVVQFSAKS